MDRDEVVAAALEIADAHRLDTLSMQRVAKALGVGTMTLYSYVENKEDLLDGMAAMAVGEIAIPDPDAGDWESRVRALARATLDAADRHPCLPALIMTRRPTSLTMLEPIERSLADLVAAGLPDQDVADASQLLWAMIGGLLIGRRTGVFGRPRQINGVDLATVGEQFPQTVRLAPRVFDEDPGRFSRELDFALDVVIAGLRTRIASHVD